MSNSKDKMLIKVLNKLTSTLALLSNNKDKEIVISEDEYDAVRKFRSIYSDLGFIHSTELVAFIATNKAADIMLMRAQEIEPERIEAVRWSYNHIIENICYSDIWND